MRMLIFSILQASSRNGLCCWPELTSHQRRSPKIAANKICDTPYIHKPLKLQYNCICAFQGRANFATRLEPHLFNAIRSSITWTIILATKEISRSASGTFQFIAMLSFTPPVFFINATVLSAA